MLEFLARWSSFRRNVNFWDWVRNSYSDKELQRLVNEATDCSLIEIYNPLDNATMSLNKFGWENRREFSRQEFSRQAKLVHET